MKGLRNFFVVCTLVAGGCAQPRVPEPRPQVQPPQPLQSTRVLELMPNQVEPMYQELLPIDLVTLVRVAYAENLDIQQARVRVEAAQGRMERAVGAFFPVIVPMGLFEDLTGENINSDGQMFDVDFHTFHPTIALQWVINPGKVIFDLVAARKRLESSEYQEEAVIIGVLGRAVTQYYDLVLAQATVQAARQALEEARELMRITEVRLRTGTGVTADGKRAEARYAERAQDVAVALNAFYEASIDLGMTLQLDPTVTLIPTATEVEPVQLVRGDLDVHTLIGYAVRFRPDLEGLRTIVEAAGAESGATFWGAFGPALELSMRYGLIRSHDELENGPERTYDFADQTLYRAGYQFRWSLESFGELKTANAREQQAMIEAERRLQLVQAQVVKADRSSSLNSELIDLAGQQVEAADEALRLMVANLQAGVVATIDVLQAQDAAAQARLRYANAVVDYNQSQVDLLAALGLLDAQGLGVQLQLEEAAPDADQAEVDQTALAD